MPVFLGRTRIFMQAVYGFYITDKIIRIRRGWIPVHYQTIASPDATCT